MIKYLQRAAVAVRYLMIVRGVHRRFHLAVSLRCLPLEMVGKWHGRVSVQRICPRNHAAFIIVWLACAGLFIPHSLCGSSISVLSPPLLPVPVPVETHPPNDTRLIALPKLPPNL